MLRISLILSICVIATLMFLSLWVKLEPPPTSTLPERHREIQEEIEPEITVPAVVLAINEKNRSISSFSCDQITVRTWERGLKFRLTATMSYERQNRFRMIIQSVFGSEVDLGSNDEIFWYWSRRDPHPGLYWAYHKDYHKTRLKTPFNPLFMRDSLGLSEIDITDARFGETETTVVVSYNRVNAMGKSIVYTIFIDKGNEQIEGILINDTEGNPLAVAEVQRRPDGLPAKILYTWYEENRMLGLEFANPSINGQNANSLWLPLDYQPQINMAEE